MKREKAMKFKLLTAYIAVFWIAVFIGGLWVLKMLIQSSVPEFGIGVVGGLIYGLAMRAVWNVVYQSVIDAANEFRQRPNIDHE